MAAFLSNATVTDVLRSQVAVLTLVPLSWVACSLLRRPPWRSGLLLGLDTLGDPRRTVGVDSFSRCEIEKCLAPPWARAVHSSGQSGNRGLLNYNPIPPSGGSRR